MSNVVNLRPPEHITPSSIADMTEKQVDDLISAIRMRRTNSALMVAEATSHSKRLSPVDLKGKIKKLADTMQKDLEYITAKIEKIEDNNNKIRALRLQMEDL